MGFAIGAVLEFWLNYSLCQANKEDRTMKCNVLKSVVGTLDLSYGYLSHGQFFPGVLLYSETVPTWKNRSFSPFENWSHFLNRNGLKLLFLALSTKSHPLNLVTLQTYALLSQRVVRVLQQTCCNLPFPLQKSMVSITGKSALLSHLPTLRNFSCLTSSWLYRRSFHEKWCLQRPGWDVLHTLYQLFNA